MTVLSRIALIVVSLLALLVALGGAMTFIGCCAIDCEKFPVQCAENHRRQRNGGLVALGGAAVSVAATVAAVRVRRRRHEPA